VTDLKSIKSVAAELGLSVSRIRQLTDDGVFTAERTGGGHRRYDVEATRSAWLRYRLDRAGLPPESVRSTELTVAPIFEREFELDGLAEDRVWALVKPSLHLPADGPAEQILGYAFTEMLNNAIDHSGGRYAEVSAHAVDQGIQIIIQDDGRGAFAHLADGLGLPDHFTAIQELTKGKRTTAPERHTGEGIFFTSKAVDVFKLAANGIDWTVDNLRNDQAVGMSSVTQGTRVQLELDPATDRDLASLFQEFTIDYEFKKSRPVVKLFEFGLSFVSRSEAKRLLAGMEVFSEVEVDFSGVESVGQAFVDEMLRVWPKLHPQTVITPTGMNGAVEFMVRRGLGPRI
jgi:anti-sigma regulatory factor (Ser/Thr protein kinase)